MRLRTKRHLPYTIIHIIPYFPNWAGANFLRSFYFLVVKSCTQIHLAYYFHCYHQQIWKKRSLLSRHVVRDTVALLRATGTPCGVKAAPFTERGSIFVAVRISVTWMVRPLQSGKTVTELISKPMTLLNWYCVSSLFIKNGLKTKENWESSNFTFETPWSSGVYIRKIRPFFIQVAGKAFCLEPAGFLRWQASGWMMENHTPPPRNLT